VMRSVIGCDAACDASLKRIFGPDLERGVEDLSVFLASLGISTRASDYGIAETDWTDLIDVALAGERGKNFIGRREALATAPALSS
jgi:alcohol dehydrogenase